jgi:DNA-binding transcriptional LysR family regulator
MILMIATAAVSRKGTTAAVLEDWSEPFPGYFLYDPSRRQQPAALAALIDTLRL